MDNADRQRSLGERLVALWYQPVLSKWLWPLVPLSLLMKAIARYRYRTQGEKVSANIDRSGKLPVIVVGNITVGGTGKTPLVTALVTHLKANGWSPGIVSRGYGARIKHFPANVFPDSDPTTYGDEPVMLAQITGVPLVIDPHRPQAVKSLQASGECDIIISDDGLQHYPMLRDIEIVVVDGQRGLGNKYCLPAGPLREPAERLGKADMVVSKGTLVSPLMMTTPYDEMKLLPETVENLATGDKLTLPEFVNRYTCVHGVAGIGNPVPFFDALRHVGLRVVEHHFPDHHPYQTQDIQFNDDLPVVMTVKDAVKCRAFAGKNVWCLPVKAILDTGFWCAFEDILQHKCKR